MYPDDDLPASVCETCQSDIIYCYEFKTKCKKSDSMWQLLLKDEIKYTEQQTDIEW